MPSAYRPKAPRAKLREVVPRYLSSMRVSGRQPNRGVVFDPDAEAPQASGWLLNDHRPRENGDRYLLLEDGDVWLCKAPPPGPVGGDDQPEMEQPGASPALDAAVARWLAEPNDDLVTLLARSLADARMGGTGWLVDGEESVEVVEDRRNGGSDHGGPERRRR